MFEYTLKKKRNVKYMKIKLNLVGEIEVVAPYGMANHKIESFLRLKKDWILEKLEIIESKKMEKVINDEIYILGDKVKLPKEVTLKNTDNLREKEEKKGEIIKFLKDQSQNRITPIIEKYKELTGLNYQNISYKYMTSRWGSCNTNKKYLNFNVILVSSPIESIEYIVLHEMAHLKFPHHKKEFWDYIKLYQPDWKERKRKLIYYNL